MDKKCQKIASRFLTVLIVFLALIVVVLLFKIITGTDTSIMGVRFYYVASDSMYPTIKADSIIVVKETETNDLNQGDIISFVSRDPGIYGLVNTHRIYSIETDKDGKRVFITKGDNNPVADIYEVYPDEIKGKVIFHTMPVKVLASFLSFAATSTGFVVCIIMPLLLVAGFFFNAFLREMRAYVREDEEAEKNIRIQRELLQNPDIDMDKLTSEQACWILERITGKKIADVTPEDIEQLMRSMRGGDKL